MHIVLNTMGEHQNPPMPEYAGLSRLVEDKELILFSDESVAKGEYFSNFYGGVLVGSSQLERITGRLREVADQAGITGEMKWQKVTESRVEPYRRVIDAFFDEIAADLLKMRVMFSQNAFEPVGLTAEHRDNAYFILYYQFLKHAFSLGSVKPTEPIRLRLNVDHLPDTKAKAWRFKEYLVSLFAKRRMGGGTISLEMEDIAEVDSRRHLILQVMDVILGAMAFRLNDRHRALIEGSRRRGKRTIAKERLYKAILKRINTSIRPNFNIGMSTRPIGEYITRWDLPYAHWNFRAKNHRFNRDRTKRNPTQPT